MGIPSSMTFRRLHLQHHSNLGIHGLDTDLPSRWEAFFFKSPIRKMAWICLQPVFYSLRPLLTIRGQFSKWELYNTIAQASFDIFWVWFTGSWELLIFYHILGMCKVSLFSF